MSQQYTQQPQSSVAQHGQSAQEPQQVGYQAQTQVAQQAQQRPGVQMAAQQYRQSVSQEVQNAVADLDHLESLSEWIKSRATERGRPRIAARADDLSEIAHLEKNLLLRGSPFAEPIGQSVKMTIQQGVQELQQYAAEPEVQEALSQAQQTLSTIDQAIAQFQQAGQQQQFGGQSAVTQQ